MQQSEHVHNSPLNMMTEPPLLPKSSDYPRQHMHMMVYIRFVDCEWGERDTVSLKQQHVVAMDFKEPGMVAPSTLSTIECVICP